jgi:GTPase SAR1 family protein
MTQDEALALLRTGASIFLTGQPGSGKTHTVNRYVRELQRQGIDYAYTASTGIAATHGHGVTIHAWSGIGVREALSRRDLDLLATNRRLASRIEKTKVLIIDEISMLPARSLSLVDAVCRHIRGTQAPFGGLQVVLVGDFFQLPPVVRRERTTPCCRLAAGRIRSARSSPIRRRPGGTSRRPSATCRNSTGKATPHSSTCSPPFAPMLASARIASASPRG